MKNNNLFITPLLFVLLFSIAMSFGQSHKESYKEEIHEFKHFRIATAIGHGYIPMAGTEENNFVVLPTWGLDVQYWFNQKWAVGFKGDLEIANYIIEDKNDEKTIFRENPLILTLPVFYSPWKNNGVVFLFGPGVELEGDHDFFVMRMGVGYEMHLPKNWDVAPEIIYDLKGGYVNSFTLAIGIGKRF